MLTKDDQEIVTSVTGNNINIIQEMVRKEVRDREDYYNIYLKHLLVDWEQMTGHKICDNTCDNFDYSEWITLLTTGGIRCTIKETEDIK